MTTPYTQWAELGQSDVAISRDHAARILNGEDIELLPLLDAAGAVRRHYFDNTVSIHVLDNVQNGACPEDCGYCGQSKDSTAPIKPYRLKPVDAIVADAANAKASGAFRFCMALSGRGPSDADIDHMSQAITRIKAMGLRTCLSAGLLDQPKAQRLRDAGLDRLNHNLNTSESHYPSICSTHTYEDRKQTLAAARATGLGVCSGMIVGMGESFEDILDVAFALRELRAESIPVNFLLPIEGNPITTIECNGAPLNPQLVLRVLAMVRLTNPTAEVRVAAGRELHLRSLQPLSLHPANSLFMAGYLLTEGDDAAATLRMILDAGFTPRLDEGDWPTHLRNIIDSAPTPITSSALPESQTHLKPTVTGASKEPFVPVADVGLPQ